MKKQPKRYLEFEGTNVKVPITKITKVTVKKNFFNMEEMKDGNWRITYNGNMFGDSLKEIDCIKIIR